MFKWIKIRKEMQREINRLNYELGKAYDEIEKLQAKIPDEDGFCRTEQCLFCQHFRYKKLSDSDRSSRMCELAHHPCKHFT